MPSGRVPCAFDSRTRRILPPRLTRPFIRSVILLKATPSAGAGATVQVPTQCCAMVYVPLLLFVADGVFLPNERRDRAGRTAARYRPDLRPIRSSAPSVTTR